MKLNKMMPAWLMAIALFAVGLSASKGLAGSSIRINPRPEPRPNTNGFAYEFSNNGESLILEDRGVLYKMPFQTGSLNPLGPTDVYEFRTPQTGNTIIYSVGSHNSYQDVYTITTEGGTPIDLGLSVYNGFRRTPLTPNGDAFIYHDGTGITKQPTDGGTPTVLATDAGYARELLMTPDGNQVVYQYNAVGETNKLYRVPITGGTPTELPVYTSLSGAFISPDSSMLIDDNGYVIPLDGAGLVVNGSSSIRVYAGTNLTSDLSRLVYLQSNRVYVTPTDGSSPPTPLQPSLPDTHFFSITSDDQHVVIRESTGDLTRWHLSPIDGGGAAQLGPDIISDTWVRFVGVTSQEELIYRAHLRGDDALRIYSVPLAGGDPTVISQPDVTMFYQAATVSPDGDVIIYQAVNPDGRANLYAVSALGGEPVPLSDGFKEDYQITYWNQLQFSPDGRRIIYSPRDTSTRGAYAETYMVGMPLVLLDPGPAPAGSIAGGTGFLGGIDYLFDQVATGGTFRAEYFRTALGNLDPALSAAIDFVLTGETAQLWDLGFDGAFTGPVTLTFTYDENLLASGTSEDSLLIYHQLDDNTFEALPVLGRDVGNNTITVTTDSFSNFVLGAVPEPISAMIILQMGVVLITRRPHIS